MKVSIISHHTFVHIPPLVNYDNNSFLALKNFRSWHALMIELSCCGKWRKYIWFVWNRNSGRRDLAGGERTIGKYIGIGQRLRKMRIGNCAGKSKKETGTIISESIFLFPAYSSQILGKIRVFKRSLPTTTG